MKQKTSKKLLKHPANRTEKKAPKSLSHKVRHHARLAVVPHAKNAYRPLILRAPGIALLLLAIVGLIGYDHFSHQGSVLGIGSDITSQQLLNDTNADRAKNDIAPLTLNPKLNAAATLKANDMFAHDYWAHTSPNGIAPWHWMGQAGYAYSYAGENLAKNFQSADGVIAAWMASPEHRANLLDKNYTDVGFAVVPGTLQNQKTMLVVALYAAPKTASLAASMATPPATSPVGAPMSLAERFGVGLRSLSPEALASIILLLSVAVVALVAHQYRHNLPKAWRMSWRRHHGLYEALSMTAVAVVIVTLYSGGQI